MSHDYDGEWDNAVNAFEAARPDLDVSGTPALTGWGVCARCGANGMLVCVGEGSPDTCPACRKSVAA